MARRIWRRLELCIDQLYVCGVESLPIVAICVTVVSLMLVIEMSYHIKLVLNQHTLVPGFSTLMLVRELAPVVTALLLASRVGAAMAAELSVMKNSDQIDAIRLSGVDLFKYLVLPRLSAVTLSCMALTLIALVVATLGATVMASNRLGYLPSEYMNTMLAFTAKYDILICLIKAAVFGAIIATVAIRQGFKAPPGSRSVGTAATNAVVDGFIGTILADWVITYLA